MLRLWDRVDSRIAPIALVFVSTVLAFGCVDLVELGVKAWLAFTLPVPDDPPGFVSSDRRRLLGVLLENALATSWRAWWSALTLLGVGAKAGMFALALRHASRPRVAIGIVFGVGAVGLVCSLACFGGGMLLGLHLGERGSGALAELGMANAIGATVGTITWWFAIGALLVALYGSARRAERAAA